MLVRIECSGPRWGRQHNRQKKHLRSRRAHPPIYSVAAAARTQCLILPINTTNALKATTVTGILLREFVQAAIQSHSNIWATVTPKYLVTAIIRGIYARVYGCTIVDAHIPPSEATAAHTYRVAFIQTYIYTRGASPRQADARLDSAHARNYRGWILIIGESRLQMRQYCQGVRT